MCPQSVRCEHGQRVKDLAAIVVQALPSIMGLGYPMWRLLFALCSSHSRLNLMAPSLGRFQANSHGRWIGHAVAVARCSCVEGGTRCLSPHRGALCEVRCAVVRQAWKSNRGYVARVHGPLKQIPRGTQLAGYTCLVASQAQSPPRDKRKAA